MTRDQALDCLAREAVFMVSAEHAEEVAKAFDTDLATIGVDPTPTDRLALAPLGQFEQVAVRIKAGQNGSPQFGIPGQKAALMYQVAAALALHFGLFHDIDHALATPYHKALSEMRYIGGRAAVRIAAYFGGREAVTALRERNPFLMAALFTEDLFTGTGQRADYTKTYKMGDANEH